MKEHLKQYLDSVFACAPDTQKNRELKEEILSNLYDKYDSYLCEGFSPEEAYRKTIAGVGDLSSLFERFEAEPSQKEAEQGARIPLATEKARERFPALRALFLSLAVALYILAVIPAAVIPGLFGPVLMFVMIAIATGMILCLPLCTSYTVPADTDEEGRRALQKKHSAATLMLAGAVMAYIVCVCPVILWNALPGLGIVCMFLLIALGTVTLIVRTSLFGDALSLLQKEGEPISEAPSTPSPKKEKEKAPMTTADKIFAACSGIFWLLVVVAYFLVSFFTARWSTTWLIFVHALLLCGIVSGVFNLVRRKGTAGPIVKIVICSILLFSVLPLNFLSVDFGLPAFSFRFNTYDDSRYEHGAAELPAEAADSLDTLNIHWEDGTVAVALWEEDYIAIRESDSRTGEGVPNDDDTLRYMLANRELTIREYAPYAILLGNRGFSKHLTVLLPADTDLRDVSIEVVAADVTLSGLVDLSELDVVTVSGKLTLTDCAASEIGTESVSGDITLIDCRTNALDVDSVSGGLSASLVSAPQSVSMDSVSGSATLYLPEDIAGFRVDMDSVSGNCDTDFSAVSWSGKSCRYGNGATQIEYDSVSGNLYVKIKK